jgi:hypothetical protein
MIKKPRDSGEALEADYRAKVAAIRADDFLSWEKKELKVRELGNAYDRAGEASKQRRQYDRDLRKLER